MREFGYPPFTEIEASVQKWQLSRRNCFSLLNALTLFIEKGVSNTCWNVTTRHMSVWTEERLLELVNFLTTLSVTTSPLCSADVEDTSSLEAMICWNRIVNCHAVSNILLTNMVKIWKVSGAFLIANLLKPKSLLQLFALQFFAALFSTFIERWCLKSEVTCDETVSQLIAEVYSRPLNEFFSSTSRWFGGVLTQSFHEFDPDLLRLLILTSAQLSLLSHCVFAGKICRSWVDEFCAEKGVDRVIDLFIDHDEYLNSFLLCQTLLDWYGQSKPEVSCHKFWVVFFAFVNWNNDLLFDMISSKEGKFLFAFTMYLKLIRKQKTKFFNDLKNLDISFDVCCAKLLKVEDTVAEQECLKVEIVEVINNEKRQRTLVIGKRRTPDLQSNETERKLTIVVNCPLNAVAKLFRRLRDMLSTKHIEFSVKPLVKNIDAVLSTIGESIE
ncbi:unnamed protein product [Soboliphyme baturini]|uniref:LINES_N domain-containing protein n=1 Tax=Soboliphyme baturini TaxID=241478 RepID=A0A183ICA0_9BILA|nr:unnamed protein product [Soboliphyme baturini]